MNLQYNDNDGTITGYEWNNDWLSGWATPEKNENQDHHFMCMVEDRTCSKKAIRILK